VRGELKVVSPQGFVGIHLRLQSHIQELPLLALDGQKVLGICFEAAARQLGASTQARRPRRAALHRAVARLGCLLHAVRFARGWAGLGFTPQTQNV